MKPSILLCGPPGCGKTTVGQMLAQSTERAFIDLDRLIEKGYAKAHGESLTCRQLYASKGERFFRQCESEVIVSLLTPHEQPRVIALGGGALEQPDNVTILKSLGTLIFLELSPDACYRRLVEKGIPAYLNPTQPWESFLRLYKMRLPHYLSAAHQRIDIELLSPEEIASKICEH